MLNVEAECLVTYTCELTEKDEKLVRKYAKQNKISLGDSVEKLWEEGKINIYAGEQTESDCSTQSVKYSEFNDEDES